MEINKLRQKYWEERNFSINDYRLTPQELILHDWFKYTEWLEAKVVGQSRQAAVTPALPICPICKGVASCFNPLCGIGGNAG